MTGLCLSQHRPGQHRPGQHRPAKMAAAAKPASEDVIAFDIFDEVLVDSDINLLEKLTKEEQAEICNVVQQMEHVNSREIIDFADSQELLLPPAGKCKTQNCLK